MSIQCLTWTKECLAIDAITGSQRSNRFPIHGERTYRNRSPLLRRWLFAFWNCNPIRKIAAKWQRLPTRMPMHYALVLLARVFSLVIVGYRCPCAEESLAEESIC